MKLRINIFYYPLILFIGIFCFDRLLNIPFLQEKMRIRATPMEIMDRYTRLIIDSNRKLSIKKPIVAFIGTSRSKPFQILEDLPNDTYLTSSERETMNAFYYEGRFGTHLNDMMGMLMIADRMVAENYNVDTIVIDVSPYIFFNTRLVESRWARNIYPEDFLWRQVSHFPSYLKSDTGSRLLFKTYHYRLHPFWFFKDRPLSTINPDFLAQWLIDHPNNYRYANKTDLSFQETLQSDYSKKFNIKTIRATKHLYITYDTKLKFKHLFTNALHLFKSRAKHIVLWLPPTIPIMRNIIYKKMKKAENSEKMFWQIYFKGLHDTGADKYPFYNGYKIRSKCDRWMDGSHLSPLCYGLLTKEILFCKDNPQHCKLPQKGLPYKLNITTKD